MFVMQEPEEAKRQLSMPQISAQIFDFKEKIMERY